MTTTKHSHACTSSSPSASIHTTFQGAQAPLVARARARGLLLFLALACVVGTSAQVEAQAPRRNGGYVEGYFIADFLGEYRVRVDGERRASGDLDLDPTYGGGLRAGFFSGIFTAGLMTEFRGYGNSTYSKRDFAFDLSPYLGVRIPLMDSNGTRLRLRGTLPLGFTLLDPNDDAFGDTRYKGFNAGALAGIEVVFGSFGLFTDVGLRYHRVYANADLGLLGDVKANISWTQLSVNAGLHVEF